MKVAVSIPDALFERDFLLELAGRVRGQLLSDVENGLRLVLEL